MSADACEIRQVDLQENGIVREIDGTFIGRVVENDEYNELHHARLEVEHLRQRVKRSEKVHNDIKDMLTQQGQPGNWDYDEYMRGLYNGIELALCIFEDREPELKYGAQKEA